MRGAVVGREPLIGALLVGGCTKKAEGGAYRGQQDSA